MGAPASRPGSRASHEAASASSPKASIPSAVYARAPASDCCADYLTPGRAYRVLNEDEDGQGFYITNDSGTESYCLWQLCAHLHGDDHRGSWTRLEGAASAIEARSDATGTGAAEGESAVPQADAPKVSQ